MSSQAASAPSANITVGRRRRVFAIDDRAVAVGVSGDLLGCPLIMTPAGCPDDVNRHLQEIWRGTWPEYEASCDENSSAYLGRTRYRAMPNSVRETAHRLSNVVSWCEECERHRGRQLDPLLLTEGDLDRYGNDMESGLWSVDKSGKPLSAKTIAGRQIAAIGFILWARKRGLIDKAHFRVTERKYKAASSSGATHVETRRRYAVVRRQSPAEITVPSVDEVHAAINSMPDQAAQLAARLAFFCGLRASEICGLTRDDVFSPKNRRVNAKHFISVLGKGRKRRSVEIPDELLDDLAEFRDFERCIRLRQHNEKSNVLLITHKRNER